AVILRPPSSTLSLVVCDRGSSTRPNPGSPKRAGSCLPIRRGRRARSVRGSMRHATPWPAEAVAEDDAVFPIRDLNPTRIFPYVTLALIAVNVAVYFLWQPHSNAQDEGEFLYAHAAIACEVTGQQPLTVEELNSGRCIEGNRGAVIFPEKHVALSVVVSMFL